MIRDFWAENFMSIRDRQELNFVTKGSASETVAEMPDGALINKLGILYGANASGKSNMLYAINAVFKILTFPQRESYQTVPFFYPHLLNENDSIKMHVSFYVDGIRYDYNVEYTKNLILKEEMYFYPNKSKALFYTREYVKDFSQAEIKFGGELHLFAKTQESIVENTLNNHSVLSTCVKIALKDDAANLYKLHNWLMNYYHEVDGDNRKNANLVKILDDVCEDKRKYMFYTTMMQKADFNIIGFVPEYENQKIPDDVKEQIKKESMPDEIKEKLLSPVKKTILFKSHSDIGDFDVPLLLQSKGTIKYIRILDSLYDLIKGNHVYYLDELGEDLHVDLLFYYLNVFLYNSEKSQLIITSQETSLLAQDLINENRNLVWFVEKNKSTASSEYSRGDSFGLHKNLSFYNSYKIGRLGAKPELGSFFIDLD